MTKQQLKQGALDVMAEVTADHLNEQGLNTDEIGDVVTYSATRNISNLGGYKNVSLRLTYDKAKKLMAAELAQPLDKDGNAVTTNMVLQHFGLTWLEKQYPFKDSFTGL